MVRLTEKLVLEKTKCSSLYGVRNVNLWGCSLTDVDVVARMPNLESLSLSVNKLASLRVFARCANLVDLHLRKNDIADLDEVRFLVGLERMRTLWLCDDPCALEPNYRMRVIAMLPSLLVLDGDEVTLEERRAAETTPGLMTLPSPNTRSSPGISPTPSPGISGDIRWTALAAVVAIDRSVRRIATCACTPSMSSLARPNAATDASPSFVRNAGPMVVLAAATRMERSCGSKASSMTCRDAIPGRADVDVPGGQQSLAGIEGRCTGVRCVPTPKDRDRVNASVCGD